MHIHHRENPPWMETQVDFVVDLLWNAHQNPPACQPRWILVRRRVWIFGGLLVDFGLSLIHI